MMNELDFLAGMIIGLLLVAGISWLVFSIYDWWTRGYTWFALGLPLSLATALGLAYLFTVYLWPYFI
jgi:hypothetical protein